MYSIFNLIYIVLDLYKWCLIIYIILGWLIAFNVINSYNQVVNFVLGFLSRIIEPVLTPIRRFVPTVGGIDLSPLVLFLAVWLVQSLMVEYGLLGGIRAG